MGKLWWQQVVGDCQVLIVVIENDEIRDDETIIDMFEAKEILCECCEMFTGEEEV